MSSQPETLLMEKYTALAKNQGLAVQVSFKRGIFTVVENGGPGGGVEKEYQAQEFQRHVMDMEWEQNKESVSKGAPFGFLVWWSIHQGAYPLESLKAEAPEAIKSELSGLSESSAWMKATNLGHKGVPARTGSADRIGHWLTKDMGSEERALVMEILDKSGRRVSLNHMATLTRQGTGVHLELLDRLSPAKEGEVKGIVRECQVKLDTLVGKVDDTKVRTVLTDWLISKHRVSVRGTGGVYFIPGNSPELQEEVLAVRAWVNTTGIGAFSVVRLYNDGATTVSDFQESAVTEVLDQLNQVNEELDRIGALAQANPDRDRSDSAKRRLDQVNALGKKIATLTEVLGDTLGRVEATYQLTLSRALKLQKANAELISTREVSQKSSGKKSGTAIQRNKKHNL